MSVEFSSVAQLCPTLCSPVDCSTPGFLVHHQLNRACSNSCPLSWWCHPSISSSVVPFSSRLQSFPASGSFPRSQFFASGGQSIGASASASVVCGGVGLVAKSCPTLATPWTVACQALCPWDSPGRNTGVGCHSLLQGIFLTQESNPGLLPPRQILYWLSYEGSPISGMKPIIYSVSS